MTVQMTKRIPVSEDRWRQIGELKQAGQTYDDLLGEMARAYNRSVLAGKARDALAGKGDWHDLEDV